MFKECFGVLFRMMFMSLGVSIYKKFSEWVSGVL